MPNTKINKNEQAQAEVDTDKTSVLGTIGNTLYTLGFYAEMVLVKIIRVIRGIAVFLAGVSVLLFGGIIKKVVAFFKGVAQDTVTSARHMINATRNMRQMFAQRKGKGPKPEKTLSGYLTSGVKKYAYLLGGLVRLVVPLLALGVFIFTLYSVLNMQYALAVAVDNTNIGYVENETVLEDGLGLLRMRISLAEGQDISQWQFSPRLSVGPTAVTLNKTQVADKILESSPEQIQKGYGIYVDGRLVGATENGDALRQFLEEQKRPYYNNDLPDAEVSFVRQVEVPEQQEVFLADSVKPVEELKETLLRNVAEAETHKVTAGQTLGSIALEANITLETLMARNPKLEGKDETYEPPAGSTLLIRRAQPYLQVQTTYLRSAVEPIAFTTVEREAPARFKGQKVRVQRGADGQERVWYQVVIIDGEEVEANRVEEMTERLKDPTEEIVEIGTKEGGGYYTGPLPEGIVGSGSYLWPVPGATGSSRGFLASHGGVDINAPTGTPIYASNGGVVTFSGAGAGSYWSYGNFVEILHPDGVITRYAHCSQVLVAPGQAVGQGQPIALVGSTGRSSGPHCHFETVVGGTRVNPYIYVNSPF
ncbi:peptidoglycan DD-metalloendopeptidase family protein [Ruminococcaceae bacterium OttesenSCG-928-A16]|nr:peptidoglycan DD-metalloendopeptidase family protein [Ruminococcaceae bacterium OttesenSCG-928-A16]